MLSPRIDDKLTLVINGTTRDCRVVELRKNGSFVVLAEPVFQEATGRRLYAAQRFRMRPEEVVSIVKH